MLDGAFIENPPISIKDGNIFVEGYNAELDELKRIGKSGQDWILELEAKERERTQIKNLKIGYNRVFGYYIEVSKGNVPLVKDEYGYIRKQTLTNAERYVTSELKEKEDYVKTDEYIEEMARKMGLVYPDEVIFKPED